MTFMLRPYQRESVDALYRYWGAGGGNPLLVLPTGAGKSLVAATIIREVLGSWPDMRVSVVTHVKELIAQNFAELLKLWPQAPAGIYSAGLGRRDAHARVLFCGIQSVHKKAATLGNIDLLIVDEAHLIPRSADTMYGRFIADLRERTPDMRIVGLTATPYRLDSGRLDKGADRLFDEIVHEANVSDLIDAGFLSPLVSRRAVAEIDTSKVHVRGGEFIPAELEAASMAGDVVKRAVQEIVTIGADRRQWLIFAAGVDHALVIRDALREAGITAETVSGRTPLSERDATIRAFREGHVRALTNCNVLTTGFNAPGVDLLAMLRPTLSTGLYVQMVGRGFRLAPDKKDCLVLDFAGNVRRHGPVDAIEIADRTSEKSEDDEEKADERAKTCEMCHTMVALNVRECPCCGHVFGGGYGKPKHSAQSDANATILARFAKPEWASVSSLRFRRHEKQGSPPSLRAEYQCGLETHSAWICFEHSGYACQKAARWWIEHSGRMPVPQTVNEALSRTHELRTPNEVMLRQEGKYMRVVRERFGAMEAA